MVKCKECNYLIIIIELKITIIIVYLYFCLVAAAVVVNYDYVLFFSFCFCLLLLLLLLLFVCLFVCSFFPFAKLVLFRFLSWFSSLTCPIYIHATSFFCTLVLGSSNIFYYLPVKAQCHFFVYLEVDGGQLESFCYFDHHTHFLNLYCNYFIL